ncbi:MAG: hypothetical protein GTO02_19310 [Candidatus Dadabacteria bacterium]|nr:hypothetical protein [Candidatus Dadabacteria bacterium]NIQ16458.1 hypothetical protein [Candidatus Dadabacteria bacterium]
MLTSASTLYAAPKVNINTATVEQLVELPGIGEITATKIINKRKELGKFKSLEDLKQVKGISDKKFNKLKPFISI